MAPGLTSEYTNFTLDNMGRYLCNTIQEALDSAQQTVAGRRRDFDVIVVGGGTFGSVIAHRLLTADRTRSRRILVLEAGPFVLPEHNQNMSFIGGAPDARVPWVSAAPLKFAGLTYAVGGRSLIWGGWSPESLHDAKNDEMRNWPTSVINDLRSRYFYEAADQIGVDSSNDFINGVLQEALRQQLFDGLNAGTGLGGPFASLTLDDLPDHPAVRGWRRHLGLNPDVDDGVNPADAVLREWLALDPVTPSPSRADMLRLLKLDAPLAVQARAASGLFPFNKFSAVPMLTNAARQASVEADGTGTESDARKRVLVVPSCRVLELITQTQADNWVRVVGVRAIDRTGATQEIFLAPPGPAGQGTVIIGLGSIESTRVALTTFKDSLAGRAAQRMGRNLMAHLRSNLTIRIPKAALTKLPPSAPNALQASALFMKGKANVAGVDRYFHLQITASGLSNLGTNSEAELFRKIPDIDQLGQMLQATDTSVVLTLRGIGEMVPNNPENRVELATTPSDAENGRPKAWVTLGNSIAPSGGGAESPETLNDSDLWEAMDNFTDEVALLFASGQAFEILAGERSIPVKAGATAADLQALLPHVDRRDALGSTHHEAGTLRMDVNPANGVTNEFGRIHDTTNCYVVGPAQLPTGGSPNPMLTGVALARRTADLLTTSVLPKPAPFVPAPGFRPLFDGTDTGGPASFNKWTRVSPGRGCGFALINGEIVTYGGGDFGLLYYAAEAFANFTLRVQFRIFDQINHNSGIFVRFRNPLLDPTPVIRQRLIDESAKEKLFRPDLQSDLELFRSGNRAWLAVHSGFEVQIDDHARGDPRKDYYGPPEDQFDGPGGLRKNRTGAIYKISAKDLIPNSGVTDAELQTYTPGPTLVPGIWYEFEIDVQGDAYTVSLTNTASSAKTTTSTFTNTDPDRGIAKVSGKPAGFIGLQSYPNARVAFRHIQVKP
jgi:choline dehydrogenase-like flavoprotein